MSYDILFCASTYKSADSAIRFANSVDQIDGDHLCVITGSVEDDSLWRIAQNTDAIVFASEINSLYLNRAWGFIWAALYAGLRPTYACSCDDDIEFTEDSKDILTHLDEAAEFGFSTLSFRSNAHEYMGAYEKNLDAKFATDLLWANGDCMFSQWDDNLLHGLPDTLLSTPISFYTEIEYQHRLKALTGRPLLLPITDLMYTHHFRKDPEVTALRAELFAAGHVAGLKLWEKKYGYTIGNLDGNEVWRRVENEIDYAAFPAKHIMFGEDEINWTAAYNDLRDKFEVVHG